jgi:signal transduction histidine kinase
MLGGLEGGLVPRPTKVRLDVFLAESLAAAWFTRGLFHRGAPGNAARVFDGEPYRGGLLVDKRYKVLRVYGAVQAYLRRQHTTDASLIFLLSKELQPVVHAALRRAARKRSLVKCAGIRLRNREVSITVARLVGAFERYYFVLFRDRLRSTAAIRSQRVDLAALRRREQQYRNLTGRLLRQQDDERRRVSQDLHDSAAQRLAALTMNLDILASAVAKLDTQTQQTILHSRQLAEECFREIRAIAYLLHPPLLDEMGLRAALRWYVTGFTERSGIRVQMRLGPIGRLSPAAEMALFRTAQESLTNVHQHTSSDTATIDLHNAAGWVVLEVRDAGRGLGDDLKQQDGTLSPGKLGVGIQGMRERIHRLGGSLNIDFTDTGTTVRARLPVHRELPERVRASADDESEE